MYQISLADVTLKDFQIFLSARCASVIFVLVLGAKVMLILVISCPC